MPEEKHRIDGLLGCPLSRDRPIIMKLHSSFALHIYGKSLENQRRQMLPSSDAKLEVSAILRMMLAIEALLGLLYTIRLASQVLPGWMSAARLLYKPSWVLGCKILPRLDVILPIYGREKSGLRASEEPSAGCMWFYFCLYSETAAINRPIITGICIDPMASQVMPVWGHGDCCLWCLKGRTF